MTPTKGEIALNNLEAFKEMEMEVFYEEHATVIDQWQRLLYGTGPVIELLGREKQWIQENQDVINKWCEMKKDAGNIRKQQYQYVMNHTDDVLASVRASVKEKLAAFAEKKFAEESKWAERQFPRGFVAGCAIVLIVVLLLSVSNG